MAVLIVMTHGRAHYIEEAIESLDENLVGPFYRMIIHDDSNNPSYRKWLSSKFKEYEIITPLDARGNPTGKVGCCAAYASAMRFVADIDDDWVFSTEEDFVFNRMVNVYDMMDVMNQFPHLAQMVLRRQPWGHEPKDGGFVAEWPLLYADAGNDVHFWMEHQRNWSNNPNLYRQSISKLSWPSEPGCEITFAEQLLASDANVRFGLWGKRTDPPAVTHIGFDRAGGYGY